jgi:hypothetical protein
MKKTNVPQDHALLGDLRELCYALDESGAYVLVASAGWEPANVANALAWEYIERHVHDVAVAVRAGRLSPLAYHMARHQMDAGLLGRYVGKFAWQVRRHMKPGPFRRLRDVTRQRYAAAFGISVTQLASVLPK